MYISVYATRLCEILVSYFDGDLKTHLSLSFWTGADAGQTILDCVMLMRISEIWCGPDLESFYGH